MTDATKRDDTARRTAMLRDALDALRCLQADMRRSRPKKRYAYRAIQVMASDCCEAGSETAAWIELDLETGRKLLPALRALLDVELRALKARRPTVGRTPGSGAQGVGR